MFDIVCEELRARLGEKITWINQSLGRAEILSRVKNNKTIKEPVIYTSGIRYESVLPSADLGNFSYILLEDPTEVVEGYDGLFKSKFSLMLWANLVSVYGTDSVRDVEGLKYDIIHAVNESITLRTGTAHIDKCYSEPKNVFTGITEFAVMPSAVTQPYAALKFTGYMTFNKQCYD